MELIKTKAIKELNVLGWKKEWGFSMLTESKFLCVGQPYSTLFVLSDYT